METTHTRRHAGWGGACRLRRLVGAAILLPAFFACFTSGARAQQETPGTPGTGGPLRLIVPYPPGGPSDLIARRLADRLGERLHRSVLVDNRTGGGGSLAGSFVARAEPDGNTILWNTSTMAIDPVLKPGLPYSVLRDLTPITTAVAGPMAILVNPKLPAKNIAELVAYAKANPGKLNFGTAGAGTSLHLVTEQFMLASGIKMVHIPYKGASQTVVGTISNDVQVLFNPIPTALQYGRTGGELRALAVTTAQRSKIWPELPSVAESGVPGLAGFDASIWYQLYVPSKTPEATVNRLNRDIIAVLNTPEMVQWLREQGMEVLGETPAQARQRLTSEIQRWTEVVRTANIRIE
jgi:tripartite-type tricarboxylate transporter receptor subunit TctC